MSNEKDLVKEVEVKEENAEVLNEAVEQEEVPFVRYDVGIQGTELYNITSTSGEINVQDLIQSQAVIELNTIMTLIDSGEGVGTVALFKSVKDALVVESIKSIIENKDNLDEKVKEELKEFFGIKEEVLTEEVSE